ncbi:CAAX protease self-immunity-domain containing protein [Nitzschia inconspicua]|nr:CAAX protease self-immunity-domain containing protein [Nitzschia inconspicua]
MDKVVQHVVHVFTSPTTQDLSTRQWQFDRWDVNLDDASTGLDVPCQITANMRHVDTGIEALLTFHWESDTWMYRFVDPHNMQESWIEPQVYLERVLQRQWVPATYENGALTDRTFATGLDGKTPKRSSKNQRILQIVLLAAWGVLLLVQPDVLNLSFASTSSWKLFVRNMQSGAMICLNTIGAWIRYNTLAFLLIAYVMPLVVERIFQSPSPRLVRGLSTISNISRSFHLLGVIQIRLLRMVLVQLPATLLGNVPRWTSRTICKMVELATFDTPSFLQRRHIRQKEPMSVSSIQIDSPRDSLEEYRDDVVSLSAVFHAPFLEEFIYRYSIASMFRTASTVLFRSVRLSPTSRLPLIKMPLWGVVSSVMFGMAHMCNHFPSQPWCDDGVQLEEKEGETEADATAVGSAITHCTFSMVSSLLIYIPAYQKGGMGASVGAHIAWNAMVIMEEKVRDVLLRLMQLQWKSWKSNFHD